MSMRTKAPRIIATVLPVVVAAGCDGTTSSVTPEPVEFEWQGDLTGLGNFGQLDGEAAFRWIEGADEITAAITISGDEPGAVRPWHVHVNSCAQGGDIFGADDQYPRLTIGADGTASAVADVPVVPNPNAQYHVNVHQSDDPDEFGVFIACGDMVLNGAAATGGGGGGATPPPNIPGY